MSMLGDYCLGTSEVPWRSNGLRSFGLDHPWADYVCQTKSAFANPKGLSDLARRGLAGGAARARLSSHGAN